MSEQILWELMEMEAVEKCYIYNKTEGKYGEKPAIIISNGSFVAPDAKHLEFFTLWFGQGIAHYNFKYLTQAEEKMEEILATAKVGMQMKIEDRMGRIRLIKITEERKTT